MFEIQICDKFPRSHWVHAEKVGYAPNRPTKIRQKHVNVALIPYYHTLHDSKSLFWINQWNIVPGSPRPNKEWSLGWSKEGFPTSNGQSLVFGLLGSINGFLFINSIPKTPASSLRCRTLWPWNVVARRPSVVEGLTYVLTDTKLMWLAAGASISKLGTFIWSFAYLLSQFSMRFT